jgi:dephospho-CoA kinase
VIAIGLTGGIGSGKSTVSAILAARGAVIIDGDLVYRELVKPGGPAYGPVVERFGPGVVAEDGTLDRPALAAIVFSDADALADLNAITHPIISAAVLERVAAEVGTDNAVILDIPLLVESKTLRQGVAALIVIDVPEDLAVERLMSQRGMDADDARARMAAQATRDERREHANFLIDNSGSLEDLQAEVERCWAWIEQLKAATS